MSEPTMTPANDPGTDPEQLRKVLDMPTVDPEEESE